MNHNVFRFFLFALLSLFISGAAKAQVPDFSFFDPADIIICPATMADLSPPDFASEPCQQVTVDDVDPQGKLIWVKTIVDLASTSGQNGEPLSLYISGKMSSEAYLNGEFVDRNGMPGAAAKTETTGKMDAEFYPPQNLFRIGENEVVFRASSHNGIFHLKRPLHMVAIAPSGVLANRAFPGFAPALITLGLFLLGALYFGVMAAISISRTSFLTLSAICLFAGAQLLFETMRGMVPYSYPIHDYRLLAIVVFSAAFGLSVAFHIFRTFKTPRLSWIMSCLGALSLISILAAKGFDLKAVLWFLLHRSSCSRGYSSIRSSFFLSLSS